MGLGLEEFLARVDGCHGVSCAFYFQLGGESFLSRMELLHRNQGNRFHDVSELQRSRWMLKIQVCSLLLWM